MAFNDLAVERRGPAGICCCHITNVQHLGRGTLPVVPCCDHASPSVRRYERGTGNSCHEVIVMVCAADVCAPTVTVIVAVPGASG
jgi:hypothetical protein